MQISGVRYYRCCLATSSVFVVVGLILLTLLTTATTVSGAGGGGRKRGWRQLKPAASAAAGGGGRLECGRELHDLQSKWLQAPLVVVGQWSAEDERQSNVGRGGVKTHRFNVSVTVRTVLKSPAATATSGRRRRVSEPIIIDGSRILVGEFSGVLARSQHRQQKLLCTPSRLANRRKGYILFLEPTPQPGYYRHSFLPARLNKRNLKKLNRVSCKRPNNCPQAPLLMKAIPKGVRSHGVDQQGSAATSRREISVGFVCRARGLPAPTVRWLKDGVEISYSRRARAQFKKRSNSITSRLNVKSMGPSDAGNYTCLFSNIVGTANATFEIGVDEILTAGRKALSPSSTMPNAYLCDTANLTCMNGGTCIINSLDGRRQCICPSDYSGYICEKPNLYLGGGIVV